MTEQYQITEYNQTAAALAILNEKYSGQLFEVTTTKGMDEAKKARAEVKGYRVALEKLRVELKAPALERTRLIDAEAKRITAELLALEEPIDEQIKAEEKRKEEEKAAKARAEAARLAGIAAKISAIRYRAAEMANQPSEVIRTALEQAQVQEVTEAEFQEFLPDAIEALNEVRKDLKATLNARLLHEAEAARIQAEREELAKLREAEAARKAEEVRIAEEARKTEEARLKVEREAQEAELKAQREAQEAELKAQRKEQERQEREARQAREAQEARLQQEREAIERQQAELEAQQRALEAAKAKAVKPIRKGKANDPVADLKQALNANLATAKALDEAYQRGFQAGLNSAQQAA
ncbi:MAG: hypothetical protein KDJ28_01420 [Candidatus Competibacteraceae bacterium]|nr:hypothetical protein [Candidatus Competibacteraceae bacterium]